MKVDLHTFCFDIITTTGGPLYQSPDLVRGDVESIGVILERKDVALKWIKKRIRKQFVSDSAENDNLFLDYPLCSSLAQAWGPFH